jgi:hypothetical protein
MNQMVERGQTKAYLWSWRPGDRLRTPEGEFYMVVSADDDCALVLQKLVCDRAGRPLRGVRERVLIRAIAGRDRVQLGHGRWARRVPVGAA